MFENIPVVDLAVGRSSVRQRILALLMDESSGRLHLREIQRRAATSPGTASRELAKLVSAGLIHREAEGNQVYFRAATSPLATLLRSLLVAMPAPNLKPRKARVPRAQRPAAASGTVEPAPAGATSATDDAPRIVHPGSPVGNLRGGSRTLPAVASVGIASAADPAGLTIAGRFADAIRPLYGDSLKGIYLCGARAHGPASADADVETIVVLDRVEHYGAELERTSAACAAISHELNLVVSRLFVAEADWDGGPDGVPPAVRSEAVAV